MPKKEDPLLKFNRNYTIDSETGCWIYQNIGADGYGRIFIDNKYIKAHRYSFQTFVGPLKEELEICHECNCRSCVRPDHLRQDTASSNSIDRVNFGNNGKQKLSLEQVKEIKLALKNTYYGINKDLAKKYKVHFATISDIKLGNRWSHVTVD